MGFFGPKIAARQTTTTVEPQVTKGSIGFVGPKLKERAQEGFLGPNLKPRVPLATPAPGAILKLDDRETPCIAENDCGGINTQSPVSSLLFNNFLPKKGGPMMFYPVRVVDTDRPS